MSVNWEELEISKVELEDLINFNLLSTWALDLCRVFLLHNRAYSRPLLFTEGCTLFLIYFCLFPLNLIIFRKLGWLSNNYQGLILILISSACLSCILIIITNFYLYNKAKQLKIFAVLLEKVKQYNNLISHFKLLAELNSISSVSENDNIESSEKTELVKALKLTKYSLIKSIELEKVLHRDRHLATNRYQLLANLESGLINLDSLNQDESNDYQQLLSEAIEIGLSVHKEIRKTQTLRQ
jgi:hypothetical protein